MVEPKRSCTRSSCSVVTGTTNNLGAGDISTFKVDAVAASTTCDCGSTNNTSDSDGVVTSFTLDLDAGCAPESMVSAPAPPNIVELATATP